MEKRKQPRKPDRLARNERFADSVATRAADALGRRSAEADVPSASHSVFEAAGRQLRTGAAAVGFWSAVVLPLAYLPLVVTGLHTSSEWMRFGLLVGLHVCALLLGHRYD